MMAFLSRWVSLVHLKRMFFVCNGVSNMKSAHVDKLRGFGSQNGSPVSKLYHFMHQPLKKCLCYLKNTMHILTLGAFLNPFIEWKTDPPIAPMAKAPPQSSIIRHGLKREGRYRFRIDTG